MFHILTCRALMITTFRLEGEETSLSERSQGEVGRHVLMIKIETKLNF